MQHVILMLLIPLFSQVKAYFAGALSFQVPPFLMDNPGHGGFDMLPNGTAFGCGAEWVIWGTKDYGHLVSRLVSDPNAIFSICIQNSVFPFGPASVNVCLVIQKLDKSPTSSHYDMRLSSVNDFMAKGHMADNTTYILSSGVQFFTQNFFLLRLLVRQKRL